MQLRQRDGGTARRRDDKKGFPVFKQRKHMESPFGFEGVSVICLSLLQLDSLSFRPPSALEKVLFADSVGD